MKHFNEYTAWGFPAFAKQGPDENRRRILTALELRRNAGASAAVVNDERGESWGFVSLGIPELDYRALIARNPELNSKDKETYDRAWRKFSRSPMARMYAADESVGKRKPDTRIIVK